MKNTETLKEFGGIADKYINEAALPAVKKKRGAKRAATIAACAVLLAGAAFAVNRFIINRPAELPPSTTASPDGDVQDTDAAAENTTAAGVPEAGFMSMNKAAPSLPVFPAYPDMQDYMTEDGRLDSAWNAAFDEWRTAKSEVERAAEPYKSSLTAFTQKSIKEFVLKNADKNCVFSPVNVYLALSMSAELVNGKTRGQILSLLGADDIAAVRENASALFKKTYCDDGAYVSVPANSVWLNDKISYKPDTLKSLADVYRAYAFSGTPGTEEYDGALHSWLNYATGGLLQDSVNALKMSPDMIMSLVSSLYLSAKWQNEFYKTETGIFHSPDAERECEFMLRGAMHDFYYGDGFTADNVPIEGGGEMWIILPDENKTPEKVLKSDGFYSFISDPFGWTNKQWSQVNIKLPKFDVTSDTDLKDGLQALGVTDMFLPEKADFSNISDDETEMYVDKVQHSARVKTDEKGITAAAFTVLEVSGSALPQNKVDFTVDRPFIFAVTGIDGSLLFCGTVNEP